jgi:hypothetical protein
MLFEATEQSYTTDLAKFSNVEYAMASIYEGQGYATIHHDFYLFSRICKKQSTQRTRRS